MNLMTRLSSDARHARRLRAARAEIRRVERTIARRRSAPNPGYDELRDPLFVSVMTLAVVVLIADLFTDFDTSILGGWCMAALTAIRSLT